MIINLKKILYFTTLTVLLAVQTSGCAPWYKFTIIPIEEVRKIELQKTTKKELIEKIGQPKVIVSKDEVSKLPAERIAAAGRATSSTIDSPLLIHEKFTELPYYKIDSDTFFELFSTDHELTEYHKIYYYSDMYVLIRDSPRKDFYGRKIWGYDPNSWYEPESRLWVLVNEKTGIVEDYTFRKHYKTSLKDGKRSSKYRNVIPESSLPDEGSEITEP